VSSLPDNLGEAGSGRKPPKRVVIENVTSAAKVTFDGHPCACDATKEDTEQRVRDANDVWRRGYDDDDVRQDPMSRSGLPKFSYYLQYTKNGEKVYLMNTEVPNGYKI
jgi:hypothetical protein